MSKKYNGFPVSAWVTPSTGIVFKAGAAGVLGTDTNPATIFSGMIATDQLLSIESDQTKFDLYDQITGEKLLTLTIATKADWQYKTLGDVITATKADWDVTHPVDVKFTGGATLAADATVNAAIMLVPTYC